MAIRHPNRPKLKDRHQEPKGYLQSLNGIHDKMGLTKHIINKDINMSSEHGLEGVNINQNVAILVDGNNIERSIHSETNSQHSMLNFDTLIPKLLDNRGLNRLVYFREGKNISTKLRERLHKNFHGSVRPCHKSADIPLSIKATQLSDKVDTIIIMSGDSDYVELVRHLINEGVRVEIAAVENTTSHLLVEEADYFHSITSDDWFTLKPKNSKSTKTSKKAAPKKGTRKKTTTKKD